MNDDYIHEDSNIIYVTECIPGPADDSEEYETLLADFNSQIMDSCNCDRVCIRMNCKCLKVSHGDNYDRYSFNDILMYRLNYKSEIFLDYPIMECNSNCKCVQDCGNRVVQKGPKEGLLVLPCEEKEKGLGLFTSDCIHQGAFICEYAGELLTKPQAIARSQENEAKGLMNYIFCLNEHTSFGHVTQTFVDPSRFGNIGRYMNHSCEPNCKVVPVRSEIVIPRLAIFASRDILPDEELTFNYGYSYGYHLFKDFHSSDSSSFFLSGSSSSEQNLNLEEPERKKCYCGTETCTGFLPYDQFWNY